MPKNKSNLPYQCKFNQIVGYADLRGCHRCGWNPETEARRKSELRKELNSKPPTKTRAKKRTMAVTWRERK